MYRSILFISLATFIAFGTVFSPGRNSHEAWVREKAQEAAKNTEKSVKSMVSNAEQVRVQCVNKIHGFRCSGSAMIDKKTHFFTTYVQQEDVDYLVLPNIPNESD